MFNIDNTLLTKENRSESFEIQSHPINYKVSFNDFEQNWCSEDFILIDSNIRKLYNVNHSNIFELDAIENNKNIDTCLRLSDFLLAKNFNKQNILHVIGGGITQDIGAFS